MLFQWLQLITQFWQINSLDMLHERMGGKTANSWPDAATVGVLWKKVFLEISQNSQENTCARVSFLIKLQALACNFIKKEILTQVFSGEFCETSKNTFFYRTPPDYCFCIACCHIKAVGNMSDKTVHMFYHLGNKLILMAIFTIFVIFNLELWRYWLIKIVKKLAN